MSDYINILYCKTEIGTNEEYVLAKAPTHEYIMSGDNVMIDFCGKRMAEVLNTAEFKIGSEQLELLFRVAGVIDVPKVIEKILTLNIKWEDEDERTNQGI